MKRAGLDRTFWPALALLAASLALFELTNLDLALQDRFFDFATGTWLVDARDRLGKLFFYNGPKRLIIALGLVLIVLLAGPEAWRRRCGFARRDLGVAVLTLASVPVLIGFGKAHTNVFFPSEIRRYGGDVAYVKVFERFPAGERPAREGRGFPAGHASGGFALIGLAWLRRSRAWRIGGIALGLGVGWWMGLYQMLKGAHYLSHTIVTMLVAWILVLLWRRLLRADRAAAEPGG